MRLMGIIILCVALGNSAVGARAEDAPVREPSLSTNPATDADKLPAELKFEIWARPSGQMNWDHRISSNGELDYEIGNRSWHSLFIRPLSKQNVSLGIRTTCDSDGAGQTEQLDWTCPDIPLMPTSKYVRRVKFVLVGKDNDKYQLSYRCRTDKYQGSGGSWPRETKEYPEVAEDNWCGPANATNVWLSKLVVTLKRR